MNYWLLFFFGIRLVIIGFMIYRWRLLSDRCAKVQRDMRGDWMRDLHRMEMAERGSWMVLKVTVIMEVAMTFILYKGGVLGLFFKVG